MQVFGLPGHVTRSACTASRLAAAKPDGEADARRGVVQRWLRARRDGLTAEAAARAVGVPRTTLYRWRDRPKRRSSRPRRSRPKTWTPALVLAIERLRLDFPMWGRAKIAPLVRREGFVVSEATVGRIIASLVARGVVQPVPTLRRLPRRWTRRRHALRLPKGLKPARPGDLVQIDTVYVSLAPGVAIKHFTAAACPWAGRRPDPRDPIAKWTVGQAANRATAKAATRFLDKVLAEMPFPVNGIQVDGGSEFKDACKHKGLVLYELPPKRPQLNGAVDRCNGAWRYEFYSVYELPRRIEALNPFIDSFQHLYNHHRPHGALAGLAPAKHLAIQRAKEAAAVPQVVNPDRSLPSSIWPAFMGRCYARE